LVWISFKPTEMGFLCVGANSIRQPISSKIKNHALLFVGYPFVNASGLDYSTQAGPLLPPYFHFPEVTPEKGGSSDVPHSQE
jgi:hypothetical protein